MKKAKYIGKIKKNPFDKHAWEHTELIYEYRGWQYIVTEHNNGYAFESLAEQHQREQKKIDKMIEMRMKPIPEDKSEDAWNAIDMLY